MPETAKNPKPFVSRYTETDAYRDKGEADGRARMIVGIDGKSGRFEFFHRIDEAKAHFAAILIRGLVKGMTIDDAVAVARTAYPEV